METHPPTSHPPTHYGSIPGRGSCGGAGGTKRKAIGSGSCCRWCAKGCGRCVRVCGGGGCACGWVWVWVCSPSTTVHAHTHAHAPGGAPGAAGAPKPGVAAGAPNEKPPDAGAAGFAPKAGAPAAGAPKAKPKPVAIRQLGRFLPARARRLEPRSAAPFTIPETASITTSRPSPPSQPIPVTSLLELLFRLDLLRLRHTRPP